MIHPSLDKLKAEDRAGVRIVVAMSGGVDSSVAAALLKEQGYNVIGLALKTYDLPKGTAAREKSCCSLDDMEDARRVCEKIRIPFYVLNTQKEFNAKVIEPFIHEYIMGRTPNPCVNCNTFIKFDFLMYQAAQMGADFVATGHYARIAYSADNETPNLYRATDLEKDQSYFLYTLSTAQLKKIIFPLGMMNKKEVRKLADSLDLPVAKKAESQELCFVNDNKYAEFIEKRVAKNLIPKGIIRMKDIPLGKHEGIHQFTVGQRKGLNIKPQQSKTPLYVSRIEAESGTVFVAREHELFRNGILVQDLNWLAPPDLVHDRTLMVKVRSGAKPAPGKVSLIANNQAILRFPQPLRAPTPGQSIVLYEDGRVLGGGIIERTYLWDNTADGFQAGLR